MNHAFFYFWSVIDLINEQMGILKKGMQITAHPRRQWRQAFILSSE